MMCCTCEVKTFFLSCASRDRFGLDVHMTGAKSIGNFFHAPEALALSEIAILTDTVTLAPSDKSSTNFFASASRKPALSLKTKAAGTARNPGSALSFNICASSERKS
jgi:hypothetical protein